MSLSLRAREALALVLVVLLVVAVATAAHLASVAQITLRAAADEGKLLARQLFHQSARAIRASPTPAPETPRPDASVRALLEGMVGYSRVVVYAAIVDPAGRAVIHSDPALEGTTLRPRPSLDAVLSWGALRMAVVLLGEAQIYEAQLPIRLGDRPFGTVRIGISTSLVRQELSAALIRSVALGTAALVVAVAVGLGAGRVLLQSLRRIARGMERLARGEHGATVELARGDAMGELAERVNRLGERIRPHATRSFSDRARIDGAIDSLEDAVIFLDGQRRVVFCNQAAERFLGRRVEELAGRPLEAILPDGHPLLPIEASLFEAGLAARNRPVTVERTDGQTRELVVSTYRLQDGDQGGGGVLVLKDLEAVRTVTSLVTYAQKLAALGRLTSGVAHEVKNPLNAMRIHLEILKTRLSATPPPQGSPDGSPDRSPDGSEVSANLDVIAQEIQRLDRVVQGFLRFMRPQDLHLAPVNLNAVLSDVARLTRPEAERAGVEIVPDLAPGLPAVTGDAELLQQACTNLVTNAIQAMPKGGRLTLATRLLPGGAPQGAPPGAVEVRVRDEGIGIAPEELDKIFHLYYTTKEGGSGIGLSLVYRIVQMHDGRIDVASAVGDGTTMILTLPRTPELVAT